MGGAFQNLRKWGAPKVSQNERFWGFQVSRFFEDDKGSEISARVSCIHDERDGRIVDSASKDLPAKNSRFDFMQSAMAPQAFWWVSCNVLLVGWSNDILQMFPINKLDVGCNCDDLGHYPMFLVGKFGPGELNKQPSGISQQLAIEASSPPGLNFGWLKPNEEISLW